MVRSSTDEQGAPDSPAGVGGAGGQRAEDAERPEPGDQRTGSGAVAWAWPLAFVVVMLALLGSVLYVFVSLRRLPAEAGRGARAVFEEVRNVAAAFRQGTIETEFVSYATRVEGTTYFQFATLEQTEVFRRRDTSSLLWGQLALPDVVVEAVAPVTYTYYVDLGGEWELTLADRTVRVTAPAIRFNRPAIDASEIRLEPRTTSVLRDEEAALENLRRSLSSLVTRRAAEHVPLVRELGRRKIAEFVRTWLAGSFGDGGEYDVEVVFADEAVAPNRLD